MSGPDTIRRSVYEALAALGSGSIDGLDDSSPLGGPPLRLTDTGLSVLAIALSRISLNHGGAPISPAELRGLKKVGECVKLVEEKVGGS